MSPDPTGSANPVSPVRHGNSNRRVSFERPVLTFSLDAHSGPRDPEMPVRDLKGHFRGWRIVEPPSGLVAILP